MSRVVGGCYLITTRHGRHGRYGVLYAEGCGVSSSGLLMCSYASYCGCK